MTLEAALHEASLHLMGDWMIVVEAHCGSYLKVCLVDEDGERYRAYGVSLASQVMDCLRVYKERTGKAGDVGRWR